MRKKTGKNSRLGSQTEQARPIFDICDFILRMNRVFRNTNQVAKHIQTLVIKGTASILTKVFKRVKVYKVLAQIWKIQILFCAHFLTFLVNN